MEVEARQLPAYAPESLVEGLKEVMENLQENWIQLKMSLKMEVPEAELPEMDLPEADLPDADLPEIELPDADLPEMELLEAVQVMAAPMVALVDLWQAAILVEEDAWRALFQEQVEKTTCEQVEQLASVAREVMHCHHKAVAWPEAVQTRDVVAHLESEEKAS